MAYGTVALPTPQHHWMGRIDRRLCRGPWCGILLAVSALRFGLVHCGRGHALRSLRHHACLGSSASSSFAPVDEPVAVDSRALRTQSKTSLVDSAAHASLGESARRVRPGLSAIGIVPCGRMDRTPVGTLSTKLAAPAYNGLHPVARSIDCAVEP